MELRRRDSHLHSIQAIKSGLVIKVLNVNRNGKPSLSFKKVSAIYESLDSKTLNSVPAFMSKDSYESLDAKEKRVKMESPYAERRLIKSEPEVSEFDYNTSNDSKNSDTDDKEDFNITLEQIKKQSKKRKRTYSKDDKLRKPTTEPWSGRDCDYSDLSSDKESNDLNVPILLWKNKVKMPSPPEDDADHDLKVPLSLLKPKISKRKNAKRNCNGKTATTLSQFQLSIVRSEEIFSDQHFFQPNQLDLAEIKTENPEPYISDSDKIGYCRNIEHVRRNELVANCGLPTSRKESHCCDESLNEFVGHDDPEPLQIAWDPEIGSSKKPDLEAESSWWLVLPVPKEEQVNHTVREFLPEASSSNKNQSHSKYNSKETNNGDDVSVAEFCCRDEVLSNLQTSATCSHTSPNADNSIVSAVDSSNQVEEKESQITACSVKERDGTSELHLTDTTNEFTPIEGCGYLHQPRSQQSPQRLFPARKVISPTSQERLCKAMMSVHLQEKEHNRKICKSKLYYKKQGNDMVSGAEGHDQINAAEFIKHPQKDQRKSAARVYHSKDAKVSHHSRIAPQACREYTSVQSSAENVIAFTQRQMLDIECVATNLTNQLKSMKEIVEEQLLCEDLSASLKYNVNEVKMEIANATKVETSAKKWLSIMARDCNRFCKIMRMTENGSAVCGTKVHQKVKKISFADEAGGNLCQVRLIDEDDLTSNGVKLEERYTTFAKHLESKFWKSTARTRQLYFCQTSQVWGTREGPCEFKPAGVSSVQDSSVPQRRVEKRLEGAFVLQGQ